MTTREKILVKVEESFKKAEAFFNLKFERPLNIVFKRSGTTGGYSAYKRRELMFQLDLAEHHEQDFLARTVPHEVAHYVQRAVYGYSHNGKKVMPHGKEWKYIMRRVYGLDPARCHSYDTSVTTTKRQRRFAWTCDCGKDFKLSTRMHNDCLRKKKATGSYGRMCGTCKTLQPKYATSTI